MTEAASPLAGKRALVTGGGSGIGAAIARALDRAGADVSVLGRRRVPLLDALACLSQPGEALAADVTDPASLGSPSRSSTRSTS